LQTRLRSDVLYRIAFDSWNLTRPRDKACIVLLSHVFHVRGGFWRCDRPTSFFLIWMFVWSVGDRLRASARDMQLSECRCICWDSIEMFLGAKEWEQVSKSCQSISILFPQSYNLGPATWVHLQEVGIFQCFQPSLIYIGKTQRNLLARRCGSESL